MSSEQILIPFRIVHQENLLINAECNNFAIRYLNSWQEIFPESYCTILIGPKFSGKTTLAKYWLKKNNPAIFIDLSKSQKTIIDDISRYKCIIIEDMHTAILKERKLLHIINHVIEHKKYLLLTSETDLFEKYFNLPDLISRLKSFNIISISEVTQDFAKQMLTKYLADNQIRIPFDIYPLIANHLDNFAHMHSFLNTLINAIKANPGKITKKFIKSL